MALSQQNGAEVDEPNWPSRPLCVGANVRVGTSRVRWDHFSGAACRQGGVGRQRTWAANGQEDGGQSCSCIQKFWRHSYSQDGS